MTTTSTTPTYDIISVWSHSDVEVQHHLDNSDPRFEVRQGGALKYIFQATRAWRTEKRTAIEAGADLAGVEPPTPAAIVQAGPRQQKPVPPERITPLVMTLVQLYYEENPARERAAMLERAREVVYAAVAVGLTTFNELESDVEMRTNQSHFDFECEGREKIIVYNRF